MVIPRLEGSLPDKDLVHADLESNIKVGGRKLTDVKMWQE